MKEKPSWLYLLEHPSDTLKAIVLLAERKVLDDFAPTNYTGIPLVSVVKALGENRQPKQKYSDNPNWSKSTQQDLAEGKLIKPDGRHH